MCIKVRLSSILVAIVVCVLIFTGFVTRASAEANKRSAEKQYQSNSAAVLAEPVPGGPGFVSIMGGTFTPADHTMQWNVNAGELSNPDPDNYGYYLAPVLLPQGAIVTQVVVYFNDLRGDDLLVELRRKTTSEFFQELASVSSQGSAGYGFNVDNTINVNFKTVDNRSYSYVVTVSIPNKIGTSYNNLYLVSVRVDYEFPGYMPCVTK